MADVVEAVLKTVPPRGTRDVFEAQRHTLPEAARTQYAASKLSKVPRTHARADTIIPTAAEGLADGCRGSLRTSTAEWRP